ncbi:hypothetical protein [Micromonospora sp. Llam0]|uniref:hypothetical protein n=1 Tax=Micromonospora sp. Llam0 TaxID=2485143 RepID=UPI0013156994|nr:hypothetical protein [Micromonospora sp. Llam0]
MDFGGPGEPILSGTSNLGGFRNSFPELASQYNLLFLEEPWVTENIKESCGKSLADFYRALRSNPSQAPSRGRELADRCEISSGQGRWGFTAVDYRVLVDAISDGEGLELKGFVGRSWGAVRLTYLSPSALDWAVLVRPFPVGADAQTLLSSRVDLVHDIGPSGSAIDAPQPIEGRSIPVTEFDRLSAAVELSYVDDAYRTQHAAGVLAGTDYERIGLLSDRLWGRYGESSLSPGYLARLQEICANVGPLSDFGPSIESVRDVLAASQLPCTGITHRIPHVGAGAARTCVIKSKLDAVTPADLIEESYAENDNIWWVESTQQSHGSFDGLSACLRHLGIAAES